MTRQYFGTDGVRGVYGGSIINEAFAARLGWAAATAAAAGDVLLGFDTRASGPSLAGAVARGVAAAGGRVISLGVLPTPAVALATRAVGTTLGVVITASHNPAADNGIKFFGQGGRKLSDEAEAQIESMLTKAPATFPPVVAATRDGASEYIAAMGRVLPPGCLAGWRIVVDTANGATVETTPVVFRGLGAELMLLGATPDGRNINAGVGSEHPEALAAAVLARGARLGVAHDGDGDRCILCDERGELLDGDEVLTLLACDALARGALRERTLVVTVQSNLGVDAAVAAAGGRVCRTPVGDRYVSERMRLEGAILGGESSGHIILSEISPAGDGLVAALKVIDVMRRTGRPLSQLRRALKKFPQESSAIPVREKKPLDTLPTLPGVISALERELGGAGRLLVRYSGTEPKLRLLVEAPTAEIARNALERLIAAARADLG